MTAVSTIRKNRPYDMRFTFVFEFGGGTGGGRLTRLPSTVRAQNGIVKNAGPDPLEHPNMERYSSVAGSYERVYIYVLWDNFRRQMFMNNEGCRGSSQGPRSFLIP